MNNIPSNNVSWTSYLYISTYIRILFFTFFLINIFIILVVCFIILNMVVKIRNCKYFFNLVFQNNSKSSVLFQLLEQIIRYFKRVCILHV